MNYIPGFDSLTRKDNLLAILEPMVKTQKESKVKLIIPETHYLRSAKDWEALSKTVKDEEEIYFMKEVQKTKGSSNSVLVYDLQKHSVMKSKATTHVADEKLTIVQRFLQDSLTINKYKHDLRCFVQIVSVDPLVVIFSKGYAKRSSLEFDLSKKLHKMAFSTNFEDQILHHQFDEIKNELTANVSILESAIKDAVDLDTFWTQIKSAIKTVLQTWHQSLEQRLASTFTLAVFDFIICKQGQEIYLDSVSSYNHLPASTVLLKDLNKQQAQSFLKNVMLMNEKFIERHSQTALESLSGERII